MSVEFLIEQSGRVEPCGALSEGSRELAYTEMGGTARTNHLGTETSGQPALLGAKRADHPADESPAADRTSFSGRVPGYSAHGADPPDDRECIDWLSKRVQAEWLLPTRSAGVPLRDSRTN